MQYMYFGLHMSQNVSIGCSCAFQYMTCTPKSFVFHAHCQGQQTKEMENNCMVHLEIGNFHSNCFAFNYQLNWYRILKTDINYLHQQLQSVELTESDIQFILFSYYAGQQKFNSDPCQ